VSLAPIPEAVALPSLQTKHVSTPPPLPRARLSKKEEERRGCLLLVAPISGFVVWFPIALWRMQNPQVPPWLSWVCGGVALIVPFYFIPKRDESEVGYRGPLKILCHLLCLPLGFAPVMGLAFLLGHLGFPGGKGPGAVLALAGVTIAVGLSRRLDACLFKLRKRGAADT
jgi:hypothetical protein